jgi:methyl-accepting chemotaxis protein
MSDQNALTGHFIKSDKIMLAINYGLIVYALVLAFWHGTWTEALIVGISTAIALTTIYNIAAGTAIARAAMAAGFMVMTSLHIHQAYGMIEVHFGVFVLLAVLLYYRDWLPIVTAALVIAVHHFLFFYLQNSGSGVWMLETTDNGWWIVFMHAAYVVIESGLLLWLSIDLKREAVQSTEIMQLTDKIISESSIDLTLRSSGSTSLLQRFDGFTGEVEQLAQKVRDTADCLARDGQSLAQVTHELNSAAQSQQRETDMIAAAVEQMSSAITEVSSNADAAAQAANQVDGNAGEATKVSLQTQTSIEKLAEQVDQAAQTIKALNDQSKSIGSVLDVIRGVADQTNLLALNAAIEAARAGEQGRGFAVVADEVRTLAQRTQQSTEEIDTMIEALQRGSESAVAAIEASRSNVEHCVDNTRGSLTLMEQVSEAIKNINSMNSMIASAANEQTNVIGEVTRNISNILQVSTQAADDSKQAAQAGAELLAMSDTLKDLTRRFRVSEQ